MKFINIGKLYEIDDFILAKMEIEKYLLETGKIEKKMSLPEYITYLDLAKVVYVSEQGVTPFSFKEINGEEYVHYTSESDNLNLEEFTKIVNKYKTNKIEQVNLMEMYLAEKIQPDYPYLIVGTNIYK